MTTARNMIDGKKTEGTTVRLSDRDEERAKLIAKASGVPKAIQFRIWVMEGIERTMRDGTVFDQLSSSDFSPLSDA